MESTYSRVGKLTWNNTESKDTVILIGNSVNRFSQMKEYSLFISPIAFIQRYKNFITDVSTELQLLKVLEKEIWISKRYSYKYQNSDCNMKWFRQHKMISKACENLIRLQIGKLVISLVPETVGEALPGMKPNKWPSRQMLEFFLVKLLGFASLCLYIWSLGYKTNELLLQNMEIKNLFLRNLLQTGILSRMQIVSQHLLEKSCKWYTGLYPWLQRLPELDSNWLPEGVNIPASIEEALGSELTDLRNIASLSDPKKKKQNTLQRFFNLLDENDGGKAFVPEPHKDFHKDAADIDDVIKGTTLTGKSLDDIFSGLVETTGSANDIKTGTTSNNSVSMTVPLKHEIPMKTQTQHLNKRLTESESIVTSGSLLGGENGPREEENDESHQVQLKPKKKKKKKRHSEIDRILLNQLNQSEDIGVVVPSEEVTSESKAKKKKERNQEMKRKMRDDDEEDSENNGENASKRRKPDNPDRHKQMEAKSVKGSTLVKHTSHTVFLEDDISIAHEDSRPLDRVMDENVSDDNNRLDGHQNQNPTNELLTSDISPRKRKKKKKKQHLRGEITADSVHGDLLFDDKKGNGDAERDGDKMTTSGVTTDPTELETRIDLALSGKVRKKKRKKKGKQETSVVPDLENISSSTENTFREHSKTEEMEVVGMPQNEQELDDSTTHKKKKRKRKRDKDKTIEAVNVNEDFDLKEEKRSAESVELIGNDFNSPVEVGKERKLKKKKKKKSLVGQVNVELGENGVIGMQRVRKSDVDERRKSSFGAVTVYTGPSEGDHSKVLNDVDEINVPSTKRSKERFLQKLQGKVKKKRRKNKKGWKMAFQLANDRQLSFT